MSMFFPLFFLSWILQAVFCGFAVIFATNGERLMAQRLVPAMAALVSLICIGLFLINQDFFSGLFLNLTVSVAQLALLFASLSLYWQARGTLNTLFCLVTIGTFFTSLLCFVGTPSNFFLALFFFPEAQIFKYHAAGFMVFSLIFLGTAFVAGLALTQSKVSPVSATPNLPRRRSYFALGLIGCGLLFAIYYSPALQTIIIVKKREHTMQLCKAMQNLAYEIKQTDLERSLEGKSSIYPADLGIRSVRGYLDFLIANGCLKEPLLINANELEIGNVSRTDPDETIFLQANRTQYDIHTMITNIGGVPNYAKGFLLFRKNGQGDFYRDEKRKFPELGKEPLRTPSYLSAD